MKKENCISRAKNIIYQIEDKNFDIGSFEIIDGIKMYKVPKLISKDEEGNVSVHPAFIQNICIQDFIYVSGFIPMSEIPLVLEFPSSEKTCMQMAIANHHNKKRPIGYMDEDAFYQYGQLLLKNRGVLNTLY